MANKKRIWNKEIYKRPLWMLIFFAFWMIVFDIMFFYFFKGSYEQVGVLIITASAMIYVIYMQSNTMCLLREKERNLSPFFVLRQMMRSKDRRFMLIFILITLALSVYVLLRIFLFSVSFTGN